MTSDKNAHVNKYTYKWGLTDSRGLSYFANRSQL